MGGLRYIATALSKAVILLAKAERGAGIGCTASQDGCSWISCRVSGASITLGTGYLFFAVFVFHRGMKLSSSIKHRV